MANNYKQQLAILFMQNFSARANRKYDTRLDNKQVANWIQKTGHKTMKYIYKYIPIDVKVKS